MEPTLTTQDQQLDVYKKEFGLSKNEVNMLKGTIAKGSTDPEMRMFLYQANYVKLNPFKNQCRLIIRGGNNRSATFQTTIDGYRSIAHRSNAYAGMDDIKYDTEDDDNPKWAKVTVYKMVQGTKVAFTSKARWSEYLPEKENARFMWKRMPYLMLGKVAEALALRKAFPEDLAGIYTEDEMSQADMDLSEETLIETPDQPSMESAKVKDEENHSQIDERTEEKVEVVSNDEVKEETPLEGTKNGDPEPFDRAETIKNIVDLIPKMGGQKFPIWKGNQIGDNEFNKLPDNRLIKFLDDMELAIKE